MLVCVKRQRAGSVINERTACVSASNRDEIPFWGGTQTVGALIVSTPLAYKTACSQFPLLLHLSLSF